MDWKLRNELTRRGQQHHRRDVRILLLQLARYRMIGHSPVGASSDHNSEARPYRTLGNLRVAPRLRVVPALGAVGCAMRAPYEKVAPKLRVCVVGFVREAVDFLSLCNVSRFGVSSLVAMRSLTDLSHLQNIPTSRLNDQNVRYCLDLKEHRLRNYLMSPPRRCRNLLSLIDLSYRSAIVI
jgi:hypothetical protein